MRIKYKLFPYPVLSLYSDDYKNNNFIVIPEVEKNINEIKIKFILEMDDNDLIRMIKSGLVEIVYHIECAKTVYRKIFKTNKHNYDISINEKNLNGNVDICCFIIAKNQINDYSNLNFNDDYNNSKFFIQRGSILAFYNLPRIEFIKNIEELEKMSSVFSILMKNDNKENGMHIELNRNKIQIWLEKNEFEKYRVFANSLNYQAILHSMLIFPALMYAFDMIMNDGEDEYYEYRWFKAIEKVLEGSNIILSKISIEKYTSYKLAQKILNMPLNRAFDNMINEEEEL